jgi:hypothetical protein
MGERQSPLPAEAQKALCIVGIVVHGTEEEEDGVVGQHVRGWHQPGGGVRAEACSLRTHEHLWNEGERNQIEIAARGDHPGAGDSQAG